MNCILIFLQGKWASNLWIFCWWLNPERNREHGHASPKCECTVPRGPSALKNIFLQCYGKNINCHQLHDNLIKNLFARQGHWISWRLHPIMALKAVWTKTLPLAQKEKNKRSHASWLNWVVEENELSIHLNILRQPRKKALKTAWHIYCFVLLNN